MRELFTDPKDLKERKSYAESLPALEISKVWYGVKRYYHIQRKVHETVCNVQKFVQSLTDPFEGVVKTACEKSYVSWLFKFVLIRVPLLTLFYSSIFSGYRFFLKVGQRLSVASWEKRSSFSASILVVCSATRPISRFPSCFLCGVRTKNGWRCGSSRWSALPLNFFFYSANKSYFSLRHCLCDVASPGSVISRSLTQRFSQPGVKVSVTEVVIQKLPFHYCQQACFISKYVQIRWTWRWVFCIFGLSCTGCAASRPIPEIFIACAIVDGGVVAALNSSGLWRVTFHNCELNVGGPVYKQHEKQNHGSVTLLSCLSGCLYVYTCM